MKNIRNCSNRAIELSMNKMNDDDRARAEFELNIREGNGMYDSSTESLTRLRLEIESMDSGELFKARDDLLHEIAERWNVVNEINDAINKYGYDSDYGSLSEYVYEQ